MPTVKYPWKNHKTSRRLYTLSVFKQPDTHCSNGFFELNKFLDFCTSTHGRRYKGREGFFDVVHVVYVNDINNLDEKPYVMSAAWTEKYW